MGVPKSVAIRRFEPGNNVHVKLLGCGDVNMRKIGSITVGRGQSPHMGEIYVAAEIAMGAVNVRIDGEIFTWSLCEVWIIVDVDNATFTPGRFYHDVLQDGEVKISRHSGNHANSDGKLGADATASAEGGLRMLPFFKFGVSAKGSAERTWTESNDAQANDDTRPSVTFVHHTGDIIFTAGGEAGDPRRPDTRDLRGPIVTSFKRRVADASGGVHFDEEVLTPLVQLEAIDTTKPVTGRITVQAKAQNFIINASRTEHRGEANLLMEALSEDKQAWFGRRRRAEQVLRSRVASLAAAKPCRLGGKNPAGLGEVDLFCCAFSFIPDSDRSTDE